MNLEKSCWGLVVLLLLESQGIPGSSPGWGWDAGMEARSLLSSGDGATRDVTLLGALGVPVTGLCFTQAHTCGL